MPRGDLALGFQKCFKKLSKMCQIFPSKILSCENIEKEYQLIIIIRKVIQTSTPKSEKKAFKRFLKGFWKVFKRFLIDFKKVWSFGHLVIWSLVMWSFVHLLIWSFSHGRQLGTNLGRQLGTKSWEATWDKISGQRAQIRFTNAYILSWELEP